MALADRLPRLVDAVDGTGADAMLVTNIHNVRYLTGFTGSSGFVVAGHGRAVFITDSRYETQSAEEVAGFDIVIHRARWTAEAATIIKDMGVRKLAVESRTITMEVRDALGSQLEGVEITGSKGLVEKFRQVKDEDEVEKIFEAVTRAEKGFVNNLTKVSAGVTEWRCALGLESGIRELGALRVPFDIIVASGERAALPHGIASQKQMQGGETLIIDFGGEAFGYQSDITRSGVLGAPDDRQKEIYDIVRTAQERAIDKVAPGVPCREVDLAARDYITEKGYGEYFGHGLGHGVGLEVHEGPSVSHLSEEVVEEGMVFTIEPGIYIPGWGGYRIEDMVLVTDDGCRSLTSLSKDISFNG